ncbi:MFS transporter [Kitasatospora sp. NBC_00315]|uniref:MFS transporter n=1 Tax=Kitasatospora sp. NBC_00315 TaxID=2975963 RepID=UPI00324E4831
MNLWSVHRNIKLRLGVGFVNRFLSFMLAPLMAIYLTSALGAAVAGALLSLVVIVSLASTFYGGHLADVRGRRFTLLIAETGVVAGYLGMALANSALWHSAPATYVFFLLLSCSGALAFPANDSVLMDVATPEIRTTLYTVNYWSMNLAFAFGAAVGGFFYGRHFPHLLWAGVLLSAGVLATTFAALAETAPALGSRRPEDKGVRAAFTGYVEAARDRLFARIVIAAILLSTVELQLTYYLGVRLADHFTPQTPLRLGSWAPVVDGVQMLGILRTLNTVLVVLLALVAKRLFGLFSERVGMHLGIVLFTVGFMGLAVSDNAWLLIALSFVYTVGELMNVPMRQAVMADVINPRKRSKYMALYGLRSRAAALLASFGVALGPLLTPYGMAALFAAFGGISMLLLRAPSRQREERRAHYEARAAAEAATDHQSTPEPEKAR